MRVGIPRPRARRVLGLTVPRHVAFLRAINVGGHVVTMDKLRALFTALGLKDVETFIASGNVLFAPSKGGVAALETRKSVKRAGLAAMTPTFPEAMSSHSALISSFPST